MPRVDCCEGTRVWQEVNNERHFPERICHRMRVPSNIPQLVYFVWEPPNIIQHLRSELHTLQLVGLHSHLQHALSVALSPRPAQRARQYLSMEAQGRGSLAALTQLDVWHLQGAEGLQKDAVRAVVLFQKAADLGHAGAEGCLGICYLNGRGVEKDVALAVAWSRKAADHGNPAAQFFVGKACARGDQVGVKKDLPLGKRYLELSAAQGEQDAVALLKELRQCVACGKLDVHHMVGKRCYNRRYCDGTCQLWHWNHPTDPHKLHCVQRRESAGAGGSSDRGGFFGPHLVLLTDQIAAAAAARMAGDDLFRERKYPEERPGVKQCTVVKPKTTRPLVVEYSYTTVVEQEVSCLASGDMPIVTRTMPDPTARRSGSTPSPSSSTPTTPR